VKHFLAQLPFFVGAAAQLWYARRHKAPRPFHDSASYWESRYADGGSSGVGSYGAFAEFKADVLNRFVASHGVETVIEFGCGDGNQLALARYPEYLGFDVSDTAVSRCRARFRRDPHRAFRAMRDYAGDRADLALSLDVLYHLVEDDVFARYMQTLFGASRRWVIVYSSDFEEAPHFGHVRHRRFTAWIEQQLPGWKLSAHVPNRYPYRGNFREGSLAEFFIYERAAAA
jgi:trans-aconitate methyltransferase